MSDDTWFERERLHFAARDGDLTQVERLVAGGCDVNAFDSLGLTPLHWAAKEERLDVAAFLLEHGADVNVLVGADGCGKTNLDRALTLPSGTISSPAG